MKRRLWRWMVLWLAFALTACGGGLSPAPTATLEPAETVAGEKHSLHIALVYVRSHSDDPDLYLRSGLYHRLRQAGYYRNDGSLVIDEFPLEIDPLTSDAEIEAMVEETLASLETLSFDLLITLGPLPAQRIAPAYAHRHVTTPILFADISEEEAHALRIYPSIVGIPHRQHPLQTLRLAIAMLPEAPRRILLLGSGQEALDALAIYATLQRAFPQIDFSLYTTERVVIWQEIVAGSAEEDFDAILLLSWGGLRDEHWQSMAADKVLDWTVVNAPVPLFALDEKAVRRGAAGGLVASSWETGKILAEMALAMHKGVHPTALSAEARSANLLSVNLRGVQYWGLKLPTAVVLTASIFTEFPGETQLP